MGGLCVARSVRDQPAGCSLVAARRPAAPRGALQSVPGATQGCAAKRARRRQGVRCKRAQRRQGVRCKACPVPPRGALQSVPGRTNGALHSVPGRTKGCAACPAARKRKALSFLQQMKDLNNQHASQTPLPQLRQGVRSYRHHVVTVVPLRKPHPSFLRDQTEFFFIALRAVLQYFQQ